MLFTNHIPLCIFLTFFSEILGDMTVKWIGETAHKTLIIDEGNEIQITCRSEKPINFVFPKHNTSADVLERITSNFTTSQEKDDLGFIVNTFRRPKSVYGDTGFYGCFEIINNKYLTFIDVDYLSDDIPRPLNLTYFYVKTKRSAFTDETNNPGFRMSRTDYLLIRCKPTSPDVHIELEFHHRGNRSVITSDDKVHWEPKLGFEIKNSTLISNDGQYVCKANHNNCSQEMVFAIFIHDYVEVNSPFISLNSTLEWVRYIERGSTMNLTCSVKLWNVTNYQLNWVTPQKDERIKTELRIEKDDPYPSTVINQLRIVNVTDDDERYYKCDFVNLDNNSSVSKPEVTSQQQYIKIYNSSMRFINLEYDREERNFIRRVGDSFIVIIRVEAYPFPKMEWMNPKDEKIVESERIKTWMHTENFKILWRNFFWIKKVEVNDTGVYSFRVSHKKETKTMNFSLEVKS